VAVGSSVGVGVSVGGMGVSVGSGVEVFASIVGVGGELVLNKEQALRNRLKHTSKVSDFFIILTPPEMVSYRE